MRFFKTEYDTQNLRKISNKLNYIRRRMFGTILSHDSTQYIDLRFARKGSHIGFIIWCRFSFFCNIVLSPRRHFREPSKLALLFSYMIWNASLDGAVDLGLRNPAPDFSVSAYLAVPFAPLSAFSCYCFGSISRNLVFCFALCCLLCMALRKH